MTVSKYMVMEAAEIYRNNYKKEIIIANNGFHDVLQRLIRLD